MDGFIVFLIQSELEVSALLNNLEFGRLAYITAKQKEYGIRPFTLLCFLPIDPVTDTILKKNECECERIENGNEVGVLKKERAACPSCSLAFIPGFCWAMNYDQTVSCLFT